MIISNASPLILFARVKRVDLILELFNEILVEEEVKKEVIDRGLEEGYADAIYLNQLLEEGSIKVERVKDVKPFKGVHQGEAATIQLAVEHKAKTVLMDEEDARAIAKARGLTPRGTLYILKKAVEKKVISKKQATELLDKLISQGYRLSAKHYSKFLKTIENIPV